MKLQTKISWLLSYGPRCTTFNKYPQPILRTEYFTSSPTSAHLWSFHTCVLVSDSRICSEKGRQTPTNQQHIRAVYV